MRSYNEINNGQVFDDVKWKLDRQTSFPENISRILAQYDPSTKSLNDDSLEVCVMKF